MAKADLTAERLREILHYDPDTGIFTIAVRLTNRTKVGGIAGCIDKSIGYRVVWIDGKSYRAHRLAWLYVYGKFPKKHIDHINGKKDDNRICNLREVTPFENAQNKVRPQQNNSSGYLGVSKNRKGWRARVTLHGEEFHIGTFQTKQEAHDAYLNAKRNLHPMCTL